MSEPLANPGGPTPSPASGRPEETQDQLLQAILALGKREPHFFPTLIQLVIGQSGASGVQPTAISPEVARRSLDIDESRSQRVHSFHKLFLAYTFFSLVLLFSFIFGLVWLLRDHVEFTKEILGVITLLITHGAVAGGGFYAGKARANRRRKS